MKHVIIIMAFLMLAGFSFVAQEAEAHLEVPMKYEDGKLVVDRDLIETIENKQTDKELWDEYNARYSGDDPRYLLNHPQHVGIVPNYFGQWNFDPWTWKDPYLMECHQNCDEWYERHFHIDEHEETKDVFIIGLTDAGHKIIDIELNKASRSMGGADRQPMIPTGSNGLDGGAINPDNYFYRNPTSSAEGASSSSESTGHQVAGEPIGPGNPAIVAPPGSGKPVPLKPNHGPSNEPRFDAEGTPIKGNHPVPAQIANPDGGTNASQEGDINREIEKLEKKWKELKQYLKEMLDVSDYNDESLAPTGDPYIFSITGTAQMHKQEMGRANEAYWKLNVFSDDPPIWLNMERELQGSTKLLGIDFDGDGKLTTGYEILWYSDWTSFEVLENIDYYQGVYDGVFDENDPLWDKALVMDRRQNYVHPDELGITSFGYDKEEHIIKRLPNDEYGDGSYVKKFAPEMDENTRALAICWECVEMKGGMKLPALAAIQGALEDCTIHDYRYHKAENVTWQWFLTGVDSTDMYMEAYEFCKNFDAAKANPDKYLSHWVAGVASIQHKKALGGETTNLEWALKAKANYETALEMSPDRSFYNVDYCLLHYQMSESTDFCIGAVEKAIAENPDNEGFKEVYEIITRG